MIIEPGFPDCDGFRVTGQFDELLNASQRIALITGMNTDGDADMIEGFGLGQYGWETIQVDRNG